MDDRVFYLALHLASGFGPKKKLELLEAFDNIHNLFSLSSGDLARSLTGKALSKFITDRDKLLVKADKEIEKAKKLGIRITHIEEQDYPNNLVFIPDPPIALYYKGQLSQNDFNSIAVVGCREASSNGLKNSYRLGKDLAEQGIVVVSGLAKGIDGKAHKGCLENNGRTVAVLGCGIDKYFPGEHRDLQDQIARTGCVLSEFPIGSDPIGFHFPMRNRVICGLSVGVVVVEGSQDSGALYTAGFALEYGRELYAYPGPAQSYQYSGTHLLIKKGAKLIENAGDLLEDLSLVLDLPSFKVTHESIQKTSDHEDRLNKERQKSHSDKLNSLRDDEKLVYQYLSSKEVITDFIVEQSGLQIEKVMACLTSLIIKDLCIQVGNHYLRKPLEGENNV
ncbi:MAG: hypothetical protein IEMM0008_1465 [bacterium]|nr:MAG: hypothetical protein IEMM0008_1465 [bacterium]